MIRINQIKLNVKARENELEKKVKKILGINEIKELHIVKKSIDARDKNNLMYIFSVDVVINGDEKKILNKKVNDKNVMLSSENFYSIPTKNNENNIRPIIIGAGPAGYFCGLYLARMGYKPIIFERGKCVEERTKDVQGFWNGGNINPNSNVSFGEGGAGTFSDGKLNTGIKDPQGRIKAVISDFIEFGAPEDIGYLGKPHIGTDELKIVLANMRKEIIANGGEVHFNSIFSGYEKLNDDVNDNMYRIYITSSVEDSVSSYDTNALVIAIGHSARDTFKMLCDSKINMEAKSFAMGLRIEHKRATIDSSQFGNSEEAKLLPAADYKMTFRSSNERSVYSFCMCPGGFVVNASSDEEQSVVNGMSNHARDEVNSNSAIVVNVTPEDFNAAGFSEYGCLAGVEFQKQYEKLSYREGQGKIPVQTFGDYVDNVPTKELGEIKPNIKGSYTLANLNNCLPSYINSAIIEGINYYDKRLKGFADRMAVLSGIESRTSSPVRILRDEKFMSSYKGIFPCGEGAGYAGGITSAAVDGIKVAEAVNEMFNSAK